jgi:hypothetical protein
LRDAFTSIFVLEQWRSPLEMLHTASNTFLVGIGYLIGYPVVSVSVKALQGLWTNDLVALKGSCPNCGEEVGPFCYYIKDISTSALWSLLKHHRFCVVSQCKI